MRYHEELKQIPQRLDASATLEERARQAFRLRQDAQTRARDAMQDRVSLASLPTPRTWDAIVARYRAAALSGDALWQAIIDAASRAGRTIDDAAGL
jgi:hypothetical protein